jgi:DNA-binding CsgD family transcriptional regulator
VTGKGLSRDEIARKLGISPRTLDRRRTEWREKLGSSGWSPRTQRGEEGDRGK